MWWYLYTLCYSILYYIKEGWSPQPASTSSFAFELLVGFSQGKHKQNIRVKKESEVNIYLFSFFFLYTGWLHPRGPSLFRVYRLLCFFHLFKPRGGNSILLVVKRAYTLVISLHIADTGSLYSTFLKQSQFQYAFCFISLWDPDQ